MGNWKTISVGKVVLDPTPILRTITVEVAEQGLELLGVDFDDFMRGDEVAPRLALKQAREFFRIVLENADAYRLGEWPLNLLQVAADVIRDSFFLDCKRSVWGPVSITTA